MLILEIQIGTQVKVITVSVSSLNTTTSFIRTLCNCEQNRMYEPIVFLGPRTLHIVYRCLLMEDNDKEGSEQIMGT